MYESFREKKIPPELERVIHGALPFIPVPVPIVQPPSLITVILQPSSLVVLLVASIVVV